jgi:hypothetical protein
MSDESTPTPSTQYLQQNFAAYRNKEDPAHTRVVAEYRTLLAKEAPGVMDISDRGVTLVGSESSESESPAPATGSGQGPPEVKKSEPVAEAVLPRFDLPADVPADDPAIHALREVTHYAELPSSTVQKVLDHAFEVVQVDGPFTAAELEQQGERMIALAKRKHGP